MRISVRATIEVSPVDATIEVSPVDCLNSLWSFTILVIQASRVLLRSSVKAGRMKLYIPRESGIATLYTHKCIAQCFAFRVS